MKRFHARVAVVKALQDAGLYIEAKDNPMQIPICSKSGDVIEPILKPQWWVNCKPLAEEAIRVRILKVFLSLPVGGIRPYTAPLVSVCPSISRARGLLPLLTCG